MRAALINPQGTIFSKNLRMKEFLEKTSSMSSFRHFWSAPCLGLLSVAAYIPDSWEVCYIDENYKTLDFSEKYDIVFISAMTVQAIRAYEISDIFRSRGILTVIGGIHATILPEEAAKHADSVIAGEGEKLFPLLISDYLKGRMKKIYQDENSGSFRMNDCITPRYELLKDYNYPIINIYTTRGCPRKCSFCCASNVFGTKYRRKPNEMILSEIDYIKTMYPDKLILFADDNLFAYKNSTYGLLNDLCSKNIRWIAQTDISISNDGEILDLMYKSGCQWIVIGFESISEESLKNIEEINFKHKYVSGYSDAIKKIQSHGIKIYGTFIVGLDGDDTSVFERTADFIINNDLYGANVTVPTPLPGTVLRKEMEKNNRILSFDWSDYTLWDVIIKPNKMSVRELEDGLLYTYQRISSSANADDRLRSIHRAIKEKRISEKHE